MKLCKSILFFGALFIGSDVLSMEAGLDDDPITLTKGLERLSLTRSERPGVAPEPSSASSVFVLTSPEEEKMFTTLQSLRTHALAPHKIYEFIRACIAEQSAGKASGYSTEALIKFFKKCKAQGFDFAARVNELGETVMHVAADQGDPYVLMILIRAGSGSCPLTKSGGTPLQFAAFRVRERTVRFLAQTLLQEHGDIDHVDAHGMTALHWLAYAPNLPQERVRLDGVVVESIAEEAKKVQEAEAKTVTVLLDAKADVMRTDKLRRTPLHWAARNGKQSIIDGLLNRMGSEEFFALFALQDRDGWTPLRGAEFFKHGKVVAALRAKYYFCVMRASESFTDFSSPLLLLICSYEYA